MNSTMHEGNRLGTEADVMSGINQLVNAAREQSNKIEDKKERDEQLFLLNTLSRSGMAFLYIMLRAAADVARIAQALEIANDIASRQRS